MCGRQIEVINEATNKNITVTVVDPCPANVCDNVDTIGLSEPAIEELAPNAEDNKRISSEHSAS